MCIFPSYSYYLLSFYFHD
uniref:Uncharacterized protein n=1 Tax=Arundo donax TaxID=35708 RepID=A0A0A9A5Q3_ARUDO